jgi:hypothetical protein
MGYQALYVSNNAERPTQYRYRYEVCTQHKHTRIHGIRAFQVVNNALRSSMMWHLVVLYWLALFRRKTLPLSSRSSELLKSIYRTIHRHIPEDRCFKTCTAIGRHRVNFLSYYGNYRLSPDIWHLTRNKHKHSYKFSIQCSLNSNNYQQSEVWSLNVIYVNCKITEDQSPLGYDLW